VVNYAIVSEVCVAGAGTAAASVAGQDGSLD